MPAPCTAATMSCKPLWSWELEVSMTDLEWRRVRCFSEVIWRVSLVVQRNQAVLVSSSRAMLHGQAAAWAGGCDCYKRHSTALASTPWCCVGLRKLLDKDAQHLKLSENLFFFPTIDYFRLTVLLHSNSVFSSWAVQWLLGCSLGWFNPCNSCG